MDRVPIYAVFFTLPFKVEKATNITVNRNGYTWV